MPFYYILQFGQLRLFLPAYQGLSEKVSLLLNERICSTWEQILSFYSRPFFGGRQHFASPESFICGKV